MATLVRFPRVGENIEEGTVGAWRRREGEMIGKGEPLVEMITDKATFDLESPESGVLFKILAAEKSAVPINYILAILDPDGARVLPDAERENGASLAAYRARATVKWDETAHARSGSSEAAVRATPTARRAAKSAGVRIEDVKPSSSNSVISEDDVERYLASRREIDADKP